MASTADQLGTQLPIWASAPFVILLGAVSILEMAARRWWDKLLSKCIVVGAAALLSAAHLIGWYGTSGAFALMHSMTDYLSFIILLTALFVIASGIEVKGSLSGTPLANMTMLAIGAILANVIGTTGAAMVLIRPYLRANARRKNKAHLVVFFIVVVANAGGLLTPLGDPPLYLGYLKGVPFEWTLGLWLPWLFVNGVVLVVFNWVDQFVLHREERAKPDEGLLDELLHHERLRLRGLPNILFLVAVVAVIVANGAGVGTGGNAWPFGVQEVMLAAIALASYLRTPQTIHASNHFSLRPMAAVAIVFFGIFVAMTAPLQILNAHSGDIGLTAQWQYFWVTGGLSSVLDNAPTYLAMTAVAAGVIGIPSDNPQYLSAMVAADGGAAYLTAISCGAVLMGCLTYLGNGPNLMVKEIAEHRGITMPNFLAYAAAAALIMVPVLIVTTLLFFWQA